MRHRSGGIALALVAVMSGGCAAREKAPTATLPATTTPPATALRDTHEQLQVVLWMQTAAEYWALSAAAYRTAQQALEPALRDPAWTAALEQTGSLDRLPPAVILDLDETVLDNSPMQAQLVLDRTDYTPAIWGAWVDKSDAGLVPGAKDFITAAAGRGLAVFFVTNRSATEQAKTLVALEKAGIAASDASVLCVGENGWTSDKAARRAQIARTHRIVLLVGDDLNDFVSTAKLTPAQRLALVQTHADRWNTRWILLPNPMYGSWERALHPGITEDDEVLLKKKEHLRGFK